jgi:hypothetical protein
MDSWMGNNIDPQSLHKYVYTYSDPVNGIDPSGKMAMVDIGTAVSISSVLLMASSNTVNPFTSRFNNSSTWSDDDWLKPNVTGILLIAAMSSSSLMLEKVWDKINEEDSNSYVLYHGTDATTASYLAGGGDIDASAVAENRQWGASSGGFYLADHPDDAFWFGMASHAETGFSVVEYTMTPSAYRTIESVSRIGPIHQAPNFWPKGNEIVVPVSAFPVFNQLKNSGQIIPGLSQF